MSILWSRVKEVGARSVLIQALFLVAFANLPRVAGAEILWSGDFSTGNFMQYHEPGNPNLAAFWHMPPYARPVPQQLPSGQSYAHTGDGSGLAIVTSPTRGGNFAARFTVKNSANGSEPQDSDYGQYPERRRTQLQMYQTHWRGNVLPSRVDRWLSISVYLPANYDFGGSGWGPIILGTKAQNASDVSSHLQLDIQGTSWQINHRWSGVQNPTPTDVPWWYQMFYNASYPNAGDWPDGLRDFPESGSQAALTAERGDWTDFVIQFHNDYRSAEQGGQGFITVWKRFGSGAWKKVVHIVPRTTTRGDRTFSHGAGYNLPPSSTNGGGYGLGYGLYMQKERVWNSSINKTIYLANIKVGDERSTFKDMSPDGSAPGEAPPLPPTSVDIQ